MVGGPPYLAGSGVAVNSVPVPHGAEVEEFAARPSSLAVRPARQAELVPPTAVGTALGTDGEDDLELRVGPELAQHTHEPCIGSRSCTNRELRRQDLACSREQHRRRPSGPRPPPGPPPRLRGRDPHAGEACDGEQRGDKRDGLRIANNPYRLPSFRTVARAVKCSPRRPGRRKDERFGGRTRPGRLFPALGPLPRLLARPSTSELSLEAWPYRRSFGSARPLSTRTRAELTSGAPRLWVRSVRSPDYFRASISRYHDVFDESGLTLSL